MITQEQIDAIEQRAYVEPGVVRAVLSRVPPSWRYIEGWQGSGGVFTRGNLQVIFSVCRYDDGEIWVHASVCGRKGRGEFYLPDFNEIKRVKHDFIGPDRWAYQVFPSEKEYVNVNPYVLHLYARMDGKPALPDFTWGTGQI